MFARALTQRLKDLLTAMPAVFLRGARQVGKTTLAKQMVRDGMLDHYFSFDEPGVLASATEDPAGFVRALPSRAVLDEVQRVPAVMPLIKMRIDERRETGDLLLTGSADPLVLPHLAESLVGRIAPVTLMPLSQAEIEGVNTNWLEEALRGEAPSHAVVPADDLLARIVRGGYPEAVLRTDPVQRADWLSAYVDTLLARDVRQIAEVERLMEMPRLLQLLSAHTCHLLNVAGISRESGIPQTTLQRYLALLEALFLLWRVPAWYTNIGKRLLKTPKVMLNDTGLACHLLGIDAERLARDPILLGQLVENFVGLEILTQIGLTARRLRLYHFRTERGEEVDFVIEDADGTLVGVEVKASATVTAEHFKGLRLLQSVAGDRFRAGFVLYWGERTLPFGEGLWAQPVSALWSPRN